MAQLTPGQRGRLEALARVLDRRAGIYRSLNGGATVAEYLAAGAVREDEELLTEPVLSDLLVEVLDFPPDGFFPQLGRSGLKPDFTPRDLVAHRYVLDAKSSTRRDLDGDEPQIRRYIDQRRLDFGVLFNLRELRVYRRGGRGHEPALSFPVLPLWQVSRGEALPSAEVERFEAFHAQFHHRPLDLDARIARIRRARPWRQLERTGERLEIDVDYLVDRLRELSKTLADDAGGQQDALDRQLRLDPALARLLLAELRLLALDVEPGADTAALPATVDGFRVAEGLAGRVWRQYMLRVSQLALTRIVLYRAWEDAGFVDERLYDGGFGDVYERLGRSVGRVLAEAFNAGRERYPWLYGAASTYDWFRPRDEALVDVVRGR